MDKNNQIVTFDLSELSLVSNNAGQIALTNSAEEFLTKWLDFEKKFEQAKEVLKQNLKSAMEENNCVVIDSEVIRIMRRFFGDKYVIVDQDAASLGGLVEPEIRLKIDTAAVDKYIKENGEVPPGIAPKDRTMSVVISSKKKDE